MNQLITSNPAAPAVQAIHADESPADALGAAGPIIDVHDLGKRFRMYPTRWGRLVEWLTLQRAVRHEAFWALRSVSFTLARGRSLGIIGVNGSGKSTLLKVLSGAMYPTTGTFAVRGRVLSLLELGTGLNAELTGRQNVIQSARLLGFPPGYAVDRLPRIEAFAELGEFFDRPVRLYSSGMLVRLSFSMFACFDPDVFIVDEALSVGDVFFQQKCVRRIEQMLAGGVTMLFVSHDMQLVRRLCDRAILLSHGQMEFDGPADECVSRYYSRSSTQSEVPPDVSRPILSSMNRGVPADLAGHDILPSARSRHGPRQLEMVTATFANEAGEHSLSLRQSGVAVIRLRLRARASIEHPTAGLHLFDRLGNLVFAAGTLQLRRNIPPMNAGDLRTVTFRLTFDLQPGEYTLSLGCSIAPENAVDVSPVQDQCEGLGPVSVHGPDGELPWFHGIARLPMEVTIV